MTCTCGIPCDRDNGAPCCPSCACPTDAALETHLRHLFTAVDPPPELKARVLAEVDRISIPVLVRVVDQ